VQLELAAEMRKLSDLRQERRDPDAPRDHQVFPGPVVQRKQVHRVGQRQLHARRHMPVHEQRPAAPDIVAPDGNLVASPILGVRHKRIGVQPAGAMVIHLDHGMRPAGKGRQVRSVARHEAEALDQLVDLDNLGHPDLEFRTAAHLNLTTLSGTSPGSSASIFTPWKAASRRE
jgi:hypothetical protein